MQLLWPQGIKHEKVLLFVTDAAKYMLKAASCLQVLYSKMIHVTCLAHALHRVAEVVRDTYPLVDSLVNLGKQIFLKAPSRVQLFQELCPGVKLPPKPVITRWGTWLEAATYYADNFTAFQRVIVELDSESEAIRKAKALVPNSQLVSQLGKIKSYYSFIPHEILLFEKQGIPLIESLQHLQEVVDKLKKVPDAAVKAKIDFVLKNNPGLNALKAIANFDAAALQKNEQLKEMSPKELSCFKYATIVSCDVERSFSNYKKILREDRTNLNVSSINMYMVISLY